jgi:hypothetical protein
MAAPASQGYRHGQLAISRKSRTRHDSGIGIELDVNPSPHAYNGMQVVETPSGRRLSDRKRLDIIMSSNSLGMVPARGNSLDKSYIMRNGERVSSYTRSVDSPIEIDDDEDETSPSKAATSPLTVLGAGRVDPFANYPVTMNRNEYWLIDHGMPCISKHQPQIQNQSVSTKYLQKVVNAAQHPTFKVFKDSWLPAGMSDPAAFHQILSNIAMSISIVHGQGVILDNPIAVAHNSLAVRTVNHRLSHPVEGISDGTLTSVLALTCHSVSRSIL